MTPDNEGGRDRSLPEAELVRLAQKEQSAEALHALVECHFAAVAALIAGYALGHGLQKADGEDVVQDFYPVLRKAILRGYDLGQLRGPNPCGLRTFLGVVALDYAVDAVGKFRRHQQHDAQALCWARELAAAGEATATPDWLEPSPAWKDEPLLVAEGDEALMALNGAVAHLTADDRLLWDGLWDRAPAEVIAGRLGVSDRTARRRWDRLLWRLWAKVGCRY